MSANTNRRKENSIGKSLFFAVIGGLICFFAFSAASAYIMVQSGFNGSIAGLMALFALSLACLSSSWLSVKLFRHGVMLCVLVVFCIYGGIPFFLNLMLNSLSLTMEWGIRLAILFFFSLIGGLLGTKKLIRKKVY